LSSAEPDTGDTKFPWIKSLYQALPDAPGAENSSARGRWPALRPFADLICWPRLTGKVQHVGPKADPAGLGSMAIASGTPKALSATTPIKIDDMSALLVIDVQNGFLPGGSLAVKDGDQVIPVINRIAKGFANVVMTQDWHTAGHISFASTHPGKKPFEVIDLPYGKQVLWPDHCVQGTDGAALSKDLSIPQAALVVRKGLHKDIDSYSAFTEADGKTTTGLAAYLKARNLQRLFVAGLATDFCVAWTALDARKAGFEAYVVEDACRGIDTEGSIAKAWADMAKAGVKRIQSSDIAA
jgi:nicotinamidase/pyrazinamidase